jgi:hypothetical protein
MRIGLAEVSGAVIILGSASFLIAAFLPISIRVFPADAAKRAAFIADSPAAWTVAQVLFGLGAVITAVGVVLLAIHQGALPFAWVMWVSAAVLALATVPWVWLLVARTTGAEAFARGALAAWPAMTYFVVTEIGLVVLGVALLLGPYPSWLGWVVAGGATVLLILTLVLGDMPPFTFYLLTLLVGVVVLVSATRTAVAS